MPSFRLMKFVFYSFILLVVLTGCGRKAEQSVSKMQMQEDKIEQEVEFRIDISTGGGFTGLTTGYSLFSSGKVKYWQRSLTGKDSLLWTKEMDKEQIRQFRESLEAAAFYGREIDQRGNMTTTVTYDKNGESRKWSMSDSGLDQDAKALRSWCRRVIDFCEKK